jgi:hypothetical protein
VCRSTNTNSPGGESPADVQQHVRTHEVLTNTDTKDGWYLVLYYAYQTIQGVDDPAIVFIEAVSPLPTAFTRVYMILRDT